MIEFNLTTIALLDKLYFKPGNLECTVINISPITISFFNKYVNKYEVGYIYDCNNLSDYEKM